MVERPQLQENPEIGPTNEQLFAMPNAPSAVWYLLGRAGLEPSFASDGSWEIVIDEFQESDDLDEIDRIFCTVTDPADKLRQVLTVFYPETSPETDTDEMIDLMFDAMNEDDDLKGKIFDGRDPDGTYDKFRFRKTNGFETNFLSTLKRLLDATHPSDKNNRNNRIKEWKAKSAEKGRKAQREFAGIQVLDGNNRTIFSDCYEKWMKNAKDYQPLTAEFRDKDFTTFLLDHGFDISVLDEASDFDIYTAFQRNGSLYNHIYHVQHDYIPMYGIKPQRLSSNFTKAITKIENSLRANMEMQGTIGGNLTCNLSDELKKEVHDEAMLIGTQVQQRALYCPEEDNGELFDVLEIMRDEDQTQAARDEKLRVFFGIPLPADPSKRDSKLFRNVQDYLQRKGIIG